MLPVMAYSQWNKDLLIKFRPYNTLIGNPSFEIEKQITPRFSVALDLKYRTHWWLGEGGEGDFGKFRPATGFRVGLLPRYYFANVARPMTGWYVGGIMRYRNDYARNLKRNGFHGEYIRTINYQEQGFEFGFMFGGQFAMGNRFTMDFALGLTAGNVVETETLVQGEMYEVYPDGFSNTSQLQLCRATPFFGWTIGYRLFKPQVASAP